MLYLPETTENGTKLVTFDVTSLYTNIPHELGKKAVRYWLEKCGDKVNSRFNDKFIIESLNIILQRNVFYFDGKYYHQRTGTAMGTKVAPTYATQVMGYLEEQLNNGLNLKYGPEISEYFQEKWRRFLDDCFILWNNAIPVETFWQELNSIHPKIQFAMDYSDKELSFLDVLVKLHNGKISTDI